MTTITILDRQQLKTLLTNEVRGPKITRNSVLIAIRRQLGDKWQSKTLFLTILYLRSLIVISFRLRPIQCDTVIVGCRNFQNTITDMNGCNDSETAKIEMPFHSTRQFSD